MIALLAAVAFVIALFIDRPGFDTGTFWTLIGLTLVAVHLAFEIALPRFGRRE